MSIYDIQGRKIRTLINTNQSVGFHSCYWDSKNDLGAIVAGHVYIYSIQTGEFKATKKMVLLK